MSRHRPGELMIAFRLSGDPARHLAAMLKAAHPKGQIGSISRFAKGLLLDVIADDRAAHEQPQREAAE